MASSIRRTSGSIAWNKELADTNAKLSVTNIKFDQTNVNIDALNKSIPKIPGLTK